jgi:mannose-1-phosphate guanylyltransferase
MFVWEARTIIHWIERLLPDLFLALEDLAAGIDGPKFQERLNRVYPQLEAVSIDHGVMEQAEEVMVIPADIGWSDVGSWTAAARYWPHIETNAVKGQACFIDATGCAVYSPDKLVALIGVKDLVVVETPDALLICPKDRDQEVREVVGALLERGRTDLV